MGKIHGYGVKTSISKVNRYFMYIFVGAITTLVNLSIFFLLSIGLQFEPNISNTFAIICAVIFAYFANKTMVFKSKSQDISQVLKELLAFFLSRGFTMLVEVIGLFLLHNIFNISAIISKFVITVLVLILNYLFMQHLVFSSTKL